MGKIQPEQNAIGSFQPYTRSVACSHATQGKCGNLGENFPGVIKGCYFQRRLHLPAKLARNENQITVSEPIIVESSKRVGSSQRLLKIKRNAIACFGRIKRRKGAKSKDTGWLIQRH